MEFIYDDNRNCKKSMLFIKFLFLMFHVFSMFYNYDNIVKDSTFYYYVLTLFSICLCTCNNFRYEYGYLQIYTHVFSSFEEFLVWKIKHQIKYLSYILNIFEISMHILFFMKTYTYLNFMEKKILFYSISCLILYMYVCIFIFFTCCACILGCSLNISLFQNFFTIERPLSSPQINNSIDIVLYIDEQKECCICLDKNTNEWLQTQCQHEFHQECIREWKSINNTCPICSSLL